MAEVAEAAISKGALQSIYNGESVESPVFQCVQIKPLANSNQGVERFRVIWSDVDNFIQSMLVTQLNNLIHDGKLQRGVIVRLKNYQQQEVKGKRILVVLDCEVLEEHGVLEKIGQPGALEPKEESKDVKQEESKQPSAISTNGFYGIKSEPQQSLPTRSNATATGNSSSYGNIYPIEALSPYAHRWTIKARITHKSDVKHWHNKNGEGRLFSVNLLDESSEIRGTAFNDVCDTLNEIFQENGVYYISSPCRVQLAKKQFSNLPNDYELMFEKDTLVEKAEDQSAVPQVRYNFTSVGDLQSVEANTTIDTIGILKEVGDISNVVSKTTQKPYNKRELTICDDSGYQVRLTIWGNSAESFETPVESVVAFKGVKVSDFGGRSLSLLSSGSMTVDPDIDESHKLKGWYDAQGRQDVFQSHVNVQGAATGSGRKFEFKTIEQVRDEQLGMSETADLFNLKATVVFIKQDNIAYPACQSEGCNKKVIETDPGEWRCEKCDKKWDRPLYRYILQLNVSDFTGQLWLSCFDDVGRLIVGHTADEMMELKENNDTAFADKITEATCQTFNFLCRAKMDTYQEQQRVRYQVSSAQPLNFAAECQKLAETIKQYSLDDSSLFVR